MRVAISDRALRDRIDPFIRTITKLGHEVVDHTSNSPPHADVWLYGFWQPNFEDPLPNIEQIALDFKGKFILYSVDDGSSTWGEKLTPALQERVDAWITTHLHQRGTAYNLDSTADKMVLIPMYSTQSNPDPDIDYSKKTNQIVFYGQATGGFNFRGCKNKRIEAVRLIKQSGLPFVGGITGTDFKLLEGGYADVAVSPLKAEYFFDLLNHSTVSLCLPGNDEFSFRHFESMSARCVPVVLENTLWYKWLLREEMEECCVVVKNDMSNLIEVCKSLLSDENKRKQISDKAYHFYKDYIETDDGFRPKVWEKIHQQFLKMDIDFSMSHAKAATQESVVEVVSPQWPAPWFGCGHIEFFKTLFRMNDIKICAELGTFLGEGSIQIAKLLPPDGRIYTVDHFKGSSEHLSDDHLRPFLSDLEKECRNRIANSGVSNKIVIVKASTSEARIPSQMDMIYVDASHDTASVIADIERFFPKLRDGGWLVGDDFAWDSVKGAIRDCVSRGIIPEVEVFRDVIWYVQKKRPVSPPMNLSLFAGVDNRGNFLQKTFEIMRDRCKLIQLIDTGSTDNTYDVCKHFDVGYTRITPLQWGNSVDNIVRIIEELMPPDEWFVHIDSDERPSPYILDYWTEMTDELDSENCLVGNIPGIFHHNGIPNEPREYFPFINGETRPAPFQKFYFIKNTRSTTVRSFGSHYSWSSDHSRYMGSRQVFFNHYKTDLDIARSTVLWSCFLPEAYNITGDDLVVFNALREKYHIRYGNDLMAFKRLPSDIEELFRKWENSPHKQLRDFSYWMDHRFVQERPMVCGNVCCRYTHHA